MERDEWTLRANKRLAELGAADEIVRQYDSGTWSCQYDGGYSPEDAAEAEYQEWCEAT